MLARYPTYTPVIDRQEDGDDSVNRSTCQGLATVDQEWALSVRQIFRAYSQQGLSLDIGLLCHFKRVFNFDSKIPHSALDFEVPKSRYHHTMQQQLWLV